MSDEGLLNGPVASRLAGKLSPPWDLFLQRVRHYEVHLQGDRIEMRRGPVEVQGFGLRLFRPAGGRVGVGFAAATDDSAESLDRAIQNAEATAPLSPSPTTTVSLPKSGGPAPTLPLVDARLWETPEDALEGYALELVGAVDPRGGVVASFGSARASLTESAILNSEGCARSYRETRLETEFAVKSSGGPEGRPPGEYWINRAERGIPSEGLAAEVASWCERARDVRRARPPPNGAQNVIFPPTVLADILPNIVGFRFGGVAAVRKMAAPAGTEVADPRVTITDDGLLPMANGSSPFDDEGSPRGRTPLIERGKAARTLVDRIHAGALNLDPTGHANREPMELANWFRFGAAPGPQPTTLVLAPGDAGSDEELIEAAGEGLWLDQLGYAFPDGATSAFGGEVRLGYRIQGGRRGEPVRGGTVGGFALGPAETTPLLSGVRGVGSRAQLVNRLSSPPLWVHDFPVASA